MAAKQKPCPLKPKHQWAFVKNVTITNASYGPSGNRITIKYRGLYQCACGAQRTGQSQDHEKGVTA